MEMEMIRSASSSTRKETRLSVQAFSFARSSSRPGVATATAAPALSCRNCSVFSTPPNTLATRRPTALPSAAATWWICTASSRVGASTRPTGPSDL